MTKMKSTKRALLSAVLALMLCIAMLVGTTYAWFTDSVTSGRNTIVSGNLDVELYYSALQADGTWSTYEKVTSTTKVFSETAQYEPGYTEVVRFKVVNEGSLALKYNLAAQVYSEIEGVNVANESFKLSNFLMTGIADVNAITDRNAAAALAVNKLGTFTMADQIALAAGAEKEIAMIITMPTTVGNEANYKKSDDPADPTKYQPSVELGVTLVATQFTAESDSFGSDYDANAPFSMWNGKVPTEMPESLVVDGATQTVHVKDAAAFAYLSTLSQKWASLYTDGQGTTYTNYVKGKGGNYYYSGQWTVSLETDIDLNNYAITPVDIVFGQSTGATAFEGNNHTIRNINTTTGLFANGTRASFSNLTLENVKATNGALAGIVNSLVTNVTVKNATISGTDYVGGLVGKTYSSVVRCKVIDSTVIATGKEAGGLIGYAETNSKGSTITSNTVKNVSVYANNRAAGLVAQPNVNIKVYDNTIDTVTVGVTDAGEYQPDAVASNALAPANVYNNTVINATVNKDIAVAANNTDLKNAAKSGGEVVVAPGSYKLPATSDFDANTTLICTPGTVFEGKSGLNINGATVTGAEFSNESGNAVSGTVNGTFKDCDFTGSNALRGCYAGENVVFENCTFSGDVYGIHFDGGSNDVLFRNCTFSGFNAMGSAITKLTLEGCIFKANDTSRYNGINLWGDTDLINCTFVFDGKASTEWVDLANSNKTVTFTNCVVTDGKTEKGVETVVGNFELGNTVIVDGTPVIFFNDDLKAAVANGNTKLLLRNGEYDLSGSQKDGLTLTGLGDNVKVANTTQFAGGKAVGAITKAVNLKNVTITNTVYTMENGSNATFTNVNFAAGFRQGYGKNVKFTDCTFGSNSEGYALHFQTDSASEGGLIKLNGCEFEGGKVHLGGKRAYEFVGCDFATGTDFQVWSNITLDGCTVNGVEVTAANVATLFPNLNLEKVTIK